MEEYGREKQANPQDSVRNDSCRHLDESFVNGRTVHREEGIRRVAVMRKPIESPRRFDAGRLMITRNVLNMIEPADVYLALGRHLRCDWGFVCEHDKLENEYSLDNHLRILSVYEDSKGHRFWIITEADRSATTILLPEDY